MLGKSKKIQLETKFITYPTEKQSPKWWFPITFTSLWLQFRDGKCFFVLLYRVFQKVLDGVFSIFHWKWFVLNLSHHLYDTTVLDFEFLPSFFIFKSSCIFFWILYDTLYLLHLYILLPTCLKY